MRTGTTRGAIYTRASKSGVNRPKQTTLILVKNLKGLEEDRVYREIEARIGLKEKVTENCRSILAYAFTEMLNNAIDHSGGVKAFISFRIDQKNVSFTVRDHGVGIFYKVRRSFKLNDEFTAMEHLFKGKQTTDPKNHSGEGIFFTSRIAEKFTLRSHEWNSLIDNQKKDVFVSEKRPLKGTLVEFLISRNTKKKLGELFSKFSNDEFEFDKNESRLKLSEHTGTLSRSQAKRLLFGLEKYRRVVLDFSGVKEIGQGFVDEVFRVYRGAHPEVLITWVNAARGVEFMIRRALVATKL